MYCYSFTTATNVVWISIAANWCTGKTSTWNVDKPSLFFSFKNEAAVERLYAKEVTYDTCYRIVEALVTQKRNSKK